MLFSNCENQLLENDEVAGQSIEELIALEDEIPDKIPIEFITQKEEQLIFQTLFGSQSQLRMDTFECFGGQGACTFQNYCCTFVNEVSDLNGDGIISAADLVFARRFFVEFAPNGEIQNLNYTPQPNDPQWVHDFADLSAFAGNTGINVVTGDDFYVIISYLLGCYPDCY